MGIWKAGASLLFHEGIYSRYPVPYAKLSRNTTQIYGKFPKHERFFPIFTKVSQLKTGEGGICGI